MKTIIVESTSDEDGCYDAFLRGHPNLRGRGESIVAALGDLFMRNPMEFSVEIHHPTFSSGSAGNEPLVGSETSRHLT